MKRYRLILLLLHAFIVLTLCVLPRRNAIKKQHISESESESESSDYESSSASTDSGDIVYDYTNDSKDDDVEDLKKSEEHKNHKSSDNDKTDKKDPVKKIVLTKKQKEWMNDAKVIMESVKVLTDNTNAMIQYLDPTYVPPNSKKLSII